MGLGAADRDVDVEGEGDGVVVVVWWAVPHAVVRARAARRTVVARTVRMGRVFLGRGRAV